VAFHELLVSDILAALADQRQPTHGRQLAWEISKRVGYEVSSRIVNQVLYVLSATPLVRKDAEIRWSLGAPLDEVNRIIGAVKLDASGPLKLHEIKFALFPSQRKSPSPPVSGPVGHWIFSFEGERKTGDEKWTFRCKLCNYVFTHRAKGAYCLLPFTGPDKSVRREHDRKHHPGELEAQTRVEHELVGLEP